MDQHQILIDLKEHGYADINERSKVRHLMEIIKTVALDNIKTSVLSSTTLCLDFTACVGIYKDFIAQFNNAEQDSLIIAGSGTEGDGKREEVAATVILEEGVAAVVVVVVEVVVMLLTVLLYLVIIGSATRRST